jgi:hypothetical protein
VSYLTDGVDLRAARLVPELRLDGGIDTGWFTVRDCLTDRQPGLSRGRCTTSDSRQTLNSHGITLGEDVPDGVGSGVSPSPALAIFDLRSPQVFSHTRTLPVAGRLRGRPYPTCWIDRQRNTNPPLAGGLAPRAVASVEDSTSKLPRAARWRCLCPHSGWAATCSGPSVAFNRQAIGSRQSCCWRTPKNRTSTWCPAPSDGTHPLPSPTGATREAQRGRVRHLARSVIAGRASAIRLGRERRERRFPVTRRPISVGSRCGGGGPWRCATPTTGEPRGSSRSIVRRPCK